MFVILWVFVCAGVRLCLVGWLVGWLAVVGVGGFVFSFSSKNK